MSRRTITSGALVFLLGCVLLVYKSRESPARAGDASIGSAKQAHSAMAGSPESGQAIRIALGQSPDGGTRIEVLGLDQSCLERLQGLALEPHQWPKLFTVYTEIAARDAPSPLPAVSGHFEVLRDRIQFKPRFPLVPGMTYIARFNRTTFESGDLVNPAAQREASADDWIEAEILVPKKRIAATTFVRSIYPSTDQIPVNLLKFYLHFSQPMSLGEAYERIHLVEKSGQEIHNAFIELEQELWDPERKRLTLLLDPGRIKRGLRPHQDLGLALELGKSYRLVIDLDWQDGDGNALQEPYEKKFTVVGIDRTAPDQASWQMTIPEARTRNPLTVDFHEPLDHALLSRFIEVRDGYQQVVRGDIELGSDETRWSLRPEAPWREGRYALRVNSALEDLAGNNLKSVFDVDRLHDRPEKEGEFVEIPFEVIAGNRP